jgi:hypothetical protein
MAILYVYFPLSFDKYSSITSGGNRFKNASGGNPFSLSSGENCSKCFQVAILLAFLPGGQSF